MEVKEGGVMEVEEGGVLRYGRERDILETLVGWVDLRTERRRGKDEMGKSWKKAGEERKHHDLCVIGSSVAFTRRYC